MTKGEKFWAAVGALAAVVGVIIALLQYVAPNNPQAAPAASQSPDTAAPIALASTNGQVPPSATSGVPSPTLDSINSPASTVAGPLYLADQTPSYDSSGGYSGGNNQVTFAKTQYLRSPQIACHPAGYEVYWAVPAGYNTFTAVAGLDDNSGGAHETAHLTFSDQNGAALTGQVDVTIGHPQQVSFPVAKVSQLRVRCSTTGDAQYTDPAFSADLGNAMFTN